jgi:hypothetical protein
VPKIVALTGKTPASVEAKMNASSAGLGRGMLPPVKEIEEYANRYCWASALAGGERGSLDAVFRSALREA